MVSLAALWLPVIVAAVIVFVASSIMHMLLPYHRSDYNQLPDEDKVRSALRSANLKRGVYIFPYCTHKDMKSPAIAEKYKEGPVGFLTIFPNGQPVMPKFLAQWFGYCLLIGFFVAYLTAHTVGLGAHYLVVFRVAGTAAFLAYGLGHLSNGIWKGQMWSTTLKEVFDGLVYGLLTAGTFGWLWPR
jgi:Flp pilus assembly protein TadB